MLKKIILLMSLISLISCSNILDQPILNAIDGSTAFDNTANAESVIFGTYETLDSYMSLGRAGKYWNAYMECLGLTSLGTNSPYNTDGPIVSGNMTNTSDPFCWNQFSILRQCNMIITQVAASTTIPVTDKTRLIAEGKFLRGVFYFYQARLYGRIVWEDKVLTVNDDLYLPLTDTPAQSYAYIIQDLTDAVAGLPTSFSQGNGRGNKYAAAAVLSEACLSAIAYSAYPNAPDINSSANQALLQKAIDNANLVINSGAYSMDNNYGEMFNENNAASKEIIWGYYRSAVNTQCQNVMMLGMVPSLSQTMVNTYKGSPSLSLNLNGWCQYEPTQNFTDDYLVKDQATGKVLPWNKTSQYFAAVDTTVSPSISIIPRNSNEKELTHGIIKPGSSQTLWTLTNTGRDLRWAASVLSDSCASFYGNILTFCIKGNASRWMTKQLGGPMTQNYGSYTNYLWRKGIYNNVSGGISKTAQTDYHYVFQRLGRVYLNLAEAYLLQGDLTNALIAFNKTRTVHGGLPASTASDLTTAWIDYKRERKVDLVLENDYYFSLLRWGLYGGLSNHGNIQAGNIPELNEAFRVMDISKNRKAFVVAQGQLFNNSNIYQHYFDCYRRYLFPIPQGQIQLNSNFTQNPNW